MGTKIHCKSYLPVDLSMRDLNEDSCSGTWPLFYGGQYCNGFKQRAMGAMVDGYLGFNKDALKQKILEHEAIFKNQVCELHRLYRIQQDMMGEARRKEQQHCGFQESAELSSSSTLRGSHTAVQPQDAWKWHMAGFHSSSSGYGQTSKPVIEFVNSPASSTKETGCFPSVPKESETSNSRPLKVRKRCFNLQLPASEYVDTEEHEKSLETDSRAAPPASDPLLENSTRLVDLNEPVEIEGATAQSNVDFLSCSSINGETNGINQPTGCGFLERSGSSKSSITHERVSNGHTDPIFICPNGSWANSAVPSQDETNGSLTPKIPVSSLNPTASAERALQTSNRALDIDLNEAASKGSSDEAVAKQDSPLINEKTRLEGCISPMPSVNHKQSRGYVVVDSEKSETVGDLNYVCTSENFFCKSEGAIGDLNQPFIPKNESNLTDCGIVRVKERDEKKLLGLPIFEPAAIKDRRISIIDINLKYEPDEVIFEEPDKKQTNMREYIDLNYSASDVEDSLVLSDESNVTGVKATPDIDLEAPILMEDDDYNTTLHDNLDLQDEVLRNAAEALFAVSSSYPQIPKEDHGFHKLDSLLWFSEALSSHANELETGGVYSGKNFSKMDEFEYATLQLLEMQEKDHMPDPFVPDTGANMLGPMSRRVQSRRGRQRKDFQRDILPGMVSLSRHEVTEDVQTFVGLMRATGHHWNSGLTRRTAGGTRGRARRRATASDAASGSRGCNAGVVQQLTNIEACLEDRRLIGWGKTPRRPRRQRCHVAGNPPPAVVLT